MTVGLQPPFFDGAAQASVAELPGNACVGVHVSGWVNERVGDRNATLQVLNFGQSACPGNVCDALVAITL